MLKIGSKAPEFVLQNDSGTETSLTDLLNDGPLVLYFYPADFTPGCTKEACDIRDIHFWAQFPGESVESGDRRLRYIAEKVLPRLR